MTQNEVDHRGTGHPEQDDQRAADWAISIAVRHSYSAFRALAEENVTASLT